MNKKSPTLAFILTLLFGPIGLLYSSVLGGVILAIVAIVSSATIVGPLLCWAASMIWGVIAAIAHNQELEEFMTRISK